VPFQNSDLIKGASVVVVGQGRGLPGLSGFERVAVDSDNGSLLVRNAPGLNPFSSILFFNPESGSAIATGLRYFLIRT
jgi:hypothetical protein